MRNKLFFVLLLFSTLGSQAFQNKNKSPKNLSDDIAAVREVLYRVLGDRAYSVKLEMLLLVT